MKIFEGALTSLLVLAGLLEAVSGSSSYLFISSPEGKTVYYSRLPTASEQSRGQGLKLQTLLQAGQVQSPRGLALNSLRKLLFVADTGAREILAVQFDESFAQDGTLHARPPVVLLKDIDADWLATDSVGALFICQGKNHRILTLSALAIKRRLDGSAGDEDDAVVVYSHDDDAPLRSPQGIAADGFRIYWANGQDGTKVGAVLQGFAATESVDEAVRVLSKRSESAFGVCLTPSRVFFTGRASFVYSMKVGSQEIVTITDALQEPRGCAYDGDGTVYVADKSEGGVYAFSGGAAEIRGPRHLSKVLTLENPFDLAVYSDAKQFSGSSRSSLAAALLAVVLSISVL